MPEDQTFQEAESDPTAQLRQELDALKAEVAALQGAGDIRSVLEQFSTIEKRLTSLESWINGFQGDAIVTANGNKLAFHGKVVGTGTHQCVDGMSVFSFDLRIQ